MKFIFCVIAFTLFPFLILHAQVSNNPYKPNKGELLEAYRRIALLDSTVGKNIYNLDLKPNWHADNSGFWYTSFSAGMRSVYEVNALSTKKKKILDDQYLLKAVNDFTGERFNLSDVKFSDSLFSEGLNIARFMVKQQWYTLNLKTNILNRLNGAGNAGKIKHNILFKKWNKSGATTKNSPNNEWTVFVMQHNIFLRKVKTKDTVQLTIDGTPELGYGEIVWSPDSKYFLAYKIRKVEAKNVYTVRSSVPNTTRGELVSTPYFQPGDENSSFEMYVFNAELKKQQIKVDMSKIDFNGPPEIHFSFDSRKFLFNRPDRGNLRFRIIEVNAAEGMTKNIVDEQANTFIYLWRVYTKFLPKSHEIIWSSEKDGYRHLYLVDVRSKNIKPITSGNWVVRGIDSVDVEKREIWFQASGMVRGEDPYNVHFYKINFSGNNLVALTPEVGNHKVKYAPDMRYFVDSYSQVNLPPVHELRRSSDGKKLTDLERSDVSYLEKNKIKTMMPFTAKGRDGVTDIYGVVCFPFNLDKGKSYPVVENIYAGPHDSFVPKNFVAYGEMQSMADLGFIVVQIDGMGTANRSKAFHDVCWKNLVDAGFPDRMLWIKAMAKKYPFADTSRVGIYGTSAGGQNSLGALLFHPDFYKAAVSSCGCHDNRVDKQPWNEQWMGYPVAKHYEEQSNVTHAANLKGKLMLILGENDANVPPESTYRVADALIKAKKDFELLTIPGAGHTDGGPYGRRRKRDFFIQNLLNVPSIDWNSL
ncbi:S9 family peptidase [Pedobacter heparinus]|uniref:S9 family peptidase n=1 Tax=Pedobacter heparinus TaxID=984 RepID=UPI00292E4216|nr:prolyl oligopeptidase family serine peptidase [Pedobacter heparinus]